MNVRRHMSVGATLLLTATFALSQKDIGPITTSVPNAKPRLGAPATVIAAGFTLKTVVTGRAALENPSGVITNFGFLSDGTLTEPDENTYLVFDNNPGGPSEGFDYGRHFVFQGHENSGNLAYITRVNLHVTDHLVDSA